MFKHQTKDVKSAIILYSVNCVQIESHLYGCMFCLYVLYRFSNSTYQSPKMEVYFLQVNDALTLSFIC